MVDARSKVAEEFCAKVFDALFVRPRDWTDAQAEAHTDATISAIIPALPRSRADALPVTQRAGLDLKAGARTNAWPTTREVVNAVREARRKIGGEATGADGWPHANSNYVVTSTAQWIQRHGEWPGYLTHPDQVAETLVAHGEFTEDELRAAGWRPRERRRAA